jgi:hypothetical protein
MKIPCRDCITLAVCKAYIYNTERRQRVGKRLCIIKMRPVDNDDINLYLVVNLIHKCSLVDKYCKRYSIASGAYYERDNIREIANYLMGNMSYGKNTMS